MFKKVAIIRCNKLWDMMRSVINFVINIAFDRTHVFSIRNITRDNNRKKRIKIVPSGRLLNITLHSDLSKNRSHPIGIRISIFFPFIIVTCTIEI